MAVNTGGSATNFGIVRIYQVSIYEGDTLVKDFVPVLDSSNVACLYEAVDDVLYYNQGSGTFNYGNVIDYSITNSITTVTSSNLQTDVRSGQSYTTVFTATSGNTLPAMLMITSGGNNLTEGVGYQYNSTTGELTIGQVAGNIVIDELIITQTDYVVSSGTEYIDTGYSPTSNTKVVMEHIPVGASYSSWMAFFGCRNGSNNTNAFYVTSGNSGYVSAFVGSYHFNNTNISYIFNTSDITETIILSATEFTILRDGVQQLSYTNSNTVSLSSANSIFIFGRNAGTGALTYGGAVKLTSFKIYENDVLVRNFVPAVTQNGIGGLLEIINNEFYTNSGAGTFTTP